MRKIVKNIITENPILATGLGVCPIIFAGISLRLGLFTSVLFLACAVASAIACNLLGKDLPRFLRVAIMFAANGIVLIILRQISVHILPDLTDALGVFLILISVNWLILSMATVAHQQSLKESIFLGLKVGGLFAFVIMIVAVIRQFIATGSVLNIDIFNQHGVYIPAATLPFAGFLTLGIIAAIANYISRKFKTEDDEEAYDD